jgi:hypothetical protein
MSFETPRRALMLRKIHSQPPPENYARARRGGEANTDLTIRLDIHGNCDVYQPMRDSWLTPVQRQLLSAIEKAAGWDPVTHKPPHKE